MVFGTPVASSRSKPCPDPDETGHYQQEHPVSPELASLLSSIPKIKFDSIAARRRLTEQFQQEWMLTPPESDKDYPYVKDTAP